MSECVYLRSRVALGSNRRTRAADVGPNRQQFSSSLRVFRHVGEQISIKGLKFGKFYICTQHLDFDNQCTCIRLINFFSKLKNILSLLFFFFLAAADKLSCLLSRRLL